MGGERAINGYRFWDDIIDNCKNFNKPAKAAWCLYDAITTFIIYAANAYNIYQSFTVLQAHLRLQGFEIGGFKRDEELRELIANIESIFGAKLVMENDTHPTLLKFGHYSNSTEYISKLTGQEFTHLYLTDSDKHIAVGIPGDKLHIRTVNRGPISKRTNYGDQSFSSGGIDAYLDVHIESNDAHLDLDNDWDTLRSQVECGMSGRIHKSNVVSFTVLDANHDQTMAAGTLATVNGDGSLSIGSENSEPNSDDVGLGNQECAPSNHDELKRGLFSIK